MISEEIYKKAHEIHQENFEANKSNQSDFNRPVFEAAKLAAESVVAASDSYRPQVVNSGTGTGKTTFCISLIAACVEAIENYSAAYVVGTICEAQHVFNELRRLVPKEELAIFTSAHVDEKSANQVSEAITAHFKEHGPSSRGNLKQRRIVICTHELWIREGKAKKDFGVRKFDSENRMNVFLDEFPNTVAIDELAPSDLDDLADELERFVEYEDQARVTRRAAEKLRVQCERPGFQFGLPWLLTRKEIELIGAVDIERLKVARDPEMASKTLIALWAAYDQRAFLVRKSMQSTEAIRGLKSLVVYHDKFLPHPGLVILDATADLAGKFISGADFDMHCGPKVNYEHLAIHQIQEPRDFDRIASRNANLDMIKAYRAWVNKIVLKHTSTGEKVLVVLPKKAADQGENRIELYGRTILVANWGMGIGSNMYRECQAVFLFSEFHLPKQVYLASCLGNSGKRVSCEYLAQVQGSSCTGDVLQTKNAHRMRHFKQMACRGIVREIDENGYATPMRLYTTMDRALLIECYADLFPGSDVPEFITVDPATLNTKGKRLADYLRTQMRQRRPLSISSDLIEEELGISCKDLKRAFHSRQCGSFVGIGWEFVCGVARKSKPKLIYDPNWSQRIFEKFNCAA